MQGVMMLPHQQYPEDLRHALGAPRKRCSWDVVPSAVGDSDTEKRCGTKADECECGRTFRCQWCLQRVHTDMGSAGLDGDADHCCSDCVTDHYDASEL